MPTPLDLPVIISQMPLAAKIANIEVIKPDAQKAMLAPHLEEEAKKRQEQVGDVEKSEDTRKVDDDTPKQHSKHAGSKRKQQEDEDGEAEEKRSESPWTGNIVNMKI
ncbi:MAG: hypothetical protein ACNI27_05040 [Desulfovibrio sp.]